MSQNLQSTFLSGNSNPTASKWQKIKLFLFPTSDPTRSIRFGQYKDLGIFLGAIVCICIFENKIKTFLEIQTDDIRKIAQQPM